MEALNRLVEKRKHPRFSIELPLEYRVTNTPQAHGAMAVNVSEEGLLVHSVNNMPVGSELTIAVLFPKGFELTNFKVLAEVVWKDLQLEENSVGYQLGLKFVHIQEEDRQKLKELLGNGHDREASHEK